MKEVNVWVNDNIFWGIIEYFDFQNSATIPVHTNKTLKIQNQLFSLTSIERWAVSQSQGPFPQKGSPQKSGYEWCGVF